MVMDDRDHATYAAGLAAALRVLGPTPRTHAIAMLRGLQLGEQEALAVLAFGLAHNLLVEDDALLSVPPAPGGAPLRTRPP
jgi:hypothetical protein